MAGPRAEDVAAAVRGAMHGERRTLQDLMAHHGNSMREAVQYAVQHAAGTARSSNEPAPSQPDAPISAPTNPPVALTRKGKRAALIAARPLPEEEEPRTKGAKRKADLVWHILSNRAARNQLQ